MILLSYMNILLFLVYSKNIEYFIYILIGFVLLNSISKYPTFILKNIKRVKLLNVKIKKKKSFLY